MNKNNQKSDAVVIVVKGFLSNTKEQSGFEDFSSVLDRYDRVEMVGYDWNTGTKIGIFVRAIFSSVVSHLFRRLVLEEQGSGVRRELAHFALNSVTISYRVWRNAMRNSLIAAPDLRRFIIENQQTYKRVIIIAHSLGCRLLLNALKERLSQKVEKIFLVAGAVEESNDLQCLARSACSVENRFSTNDNVLRRLYKIAELSALGSPIGVAAVVCGGINNIDCTSLKCGHDLAPHIEPIVQRTFPKRLLSS